jgi:hypothetical protein
MPSTPAHARASVGRDSTDIRQLLGGFEARIISLTGLGNDKSRAAQVNGDRRRFCSAALIWISMADKIWQIQPVFFDTRANKSGLRLWPTCAEANRAILYYYPLLNIDPLMSFAGG